jgi:hypothetical protein
MGCFVDFTHEELVLDALDVDRSFARPGAG